MRDFESDSIRVCSLEMCYCHCHDYLAGRYLSMNWKQILCYPLNLILGIPYCVYLLACIPVMPFILAIYVCVKGKDLNSLGEEMEFCPLATSHRIDCFFRPHLHTLKEYKTVTNRTPVLGVPEDVVIEV